MWPHLLGTVALCDVSGYKIQQSINYQGGKKCPLPFAITFNYKHKLTADICTKTKTKSRCKYNNWRWQVIGDNRAIRCDLWQRKALCLAPLGTNKHTPLNQYIKVKVLLMYSFISKALSQSVKSMLLEE